MGDCGLHRPITIRLKRGNLGRAFRAEVMALDLRGDLSQAARLLLDGPSNFRAMELAAKLGGGSFSAVYLIAPTDHGVVKIGVANDPKLRLSTLQIDNWNDLAVLGLLWFDRAAGEAKRLALLAAAEMGMALRGEWIEASLDEAAELVLKAARYAKLPCYDSGIWIENWANRVDALAESRGVKLVA